MYDCFSSPSHEMVVACLVEIPLRYEQIVKRKGDSIIWKRKEPIIYQYKETEVGANIMSTLPKYRTIQKLIPRKPLKKKLLQNAEYTKITKIVESQSAKFSEWREVLCPTCRMNYNMMSLKIKLIEHGYRAECNCTNSGLDEETKEQLLQFQKDRKLTEGIMNKRTLRELKFSEYD